MKKVFCLMMVVAVMLTFVSFPTTAVSTSENTLIIYPEYPDILPRDYDYEVTLTQGDKSVNIPVYNAATHQTTFSSIGDGFRRFCEFAFEGEVTITISVRFRFHAYAVLPSSKGIIATQNNGKISFTINKAGNYLLKLNDDKNTILSIFAEEPETNVPNENDENVLYFKAGLNNCVQDYSLDGQGRLRLSEGATVYLEPGAIVTARPFIRGSNVTVMGRGAFMDVRTDRYGDWAFMFAINDNVSADKTEVPYSNITVQGIKILDAHQFNICVREAENVLIDNVKILSNQISTDGVSLWGASGTISNVLIKDSYIFNCDDMFILSKLDSLTVQNSVFANNHRFATFQYTMGDIIFENVDIFCLETFVRANSVGVAEGWDNIVFRNVYVEDAPTINYILNIQHGSSDEKNILFENVSFPDNTQNGVFIYNTTGLNITFNNVYVGGNAVRSGADFSKYSVCSGNNITFGTSFNPALAKAGNSKLVRGTCSYQGTMRVKVGNAQLSPSKEIPFSQNGETYVPAIDVLNALGFVTEFENNVLTFKNGNTYKMKLNEKALYQNGSKSKCSALILVNGSLMLPISALNEIGFSAYLDSSVVQINGGFLGENLVKDGDFENLDNPDVTDSFVGYDLPYSRRWSEFNFGNTFSATAEAYSGNRSLLYKHEITTATEQRGLAYYLTPKLRQYGNGVYHVEFYAKLGENNTADKNIRVGFVGSNWRLTDENGPIGINDYVEFTLTNSWQKIERDITITDITLSGYSNAYFFIGPSQDKTNSGTALAEFYIDDVSITYSSAPTTQTLETAPTRENEFFLGWYYNNGELVKKNSPLNTALLMHPEFKKIKESTETVVNKKPLNLKDETRSFDLFPSECMLGVHMAIDGELQYNVIATFNDQTVLANAQLTQGILTLTQPTTYYSQARAYKSTGFVSGTLFEKFGVKPAPENYTPKTVALSYNKENKVFFVPENVTLYVGDTVTFEMGGASADPQEPPATATYTNGLYVQGAQVRIGDSEKTGLRFVVVNNVDLINRLSELGITDVSYGALVSNVPLKGEKKLTFSSVSENLAANVLAEKIFQTSESLNTNYQKYTACVVNIPKSELKTEIFVRPYLKYTSLSGGEVVLYGEQYSTNIYSTALMAYESQTESEETKQLIQNEILSQI